MLPVFLVLAGDNDLAIVHSQCELALLVAHRLDRSLYRRVSDSVIPEVRRFCGNVIFISFSFSIPCFFVQKSPYCR